MEKQYYRTFIGIPVRPGPGLMSLRGDLKASLAQERISWVQPERFHVTLRFLGTTSLSAVSDIRQSLRKMVNTPAATELQLKGVGSFGPRKRPRVIWAGFKETKLIDSLKKEVDLALEMCGVPREDKPFNAHLTLGRVRGLLKLDTYNEQIKQFSPRLNESVLVDRMVFYRSILGPEGPRYTPLEEYIFEK